MEGAAHASCRGPSTPEFVAGRWGSVMRIRRRGFALTSRPFFSVGRDGAGSWDDDQLRTILRRWKRSPPAVDPARKRRLRAVSPGDNNWFDSPMFGLPAVGFAGRNKQTLNGSLPYMKARLRYSRRREFGAG